MRRRESDGERRKGETGGEKERREKRGEEDEERKAEKQSFFHIPRCEKALPLRSARRSARKNENTERSKSGADDSATTKPISLANIANPLHLLKMRI